MGTVAMQRALFFLWCFTLSVFANQETVSLEIEHGKLLGKIEHSVLSNKLFYSFKGIPYAAPPLGDFRFKAPQPLENWTNTLEAFEYGQICTQPDERELYINIENLSNIRGGEDCLFVNVFTPELPSDELPAKLKPVLFFIHGGGFWTGSGNDFLYGPDFLMEEDVLLVTINYRLGALGFLSLENVEIPGNFGLKDQVHALQWVKKNIDKFGGDPNSVTIFGQSAGGASTNYLLISPLASGLFHKVISQSGNVVDPWALNSQSVKDRAFKLGKIFGLETTDSKKLIDHLRTISALNLTLEIKQLWPTAVEFTAPGELPFPPSIEPKEIGDAGFLISDPIELLKNGQYNKVPVMLGNTNAEYVFFLVKSQLESENLEPTITNLKISSPLRNIKVPYTADLYKNTVETIKELYSLQEFSNNSASNYIELLSDIWFNVGQELTAKILTEVSPEPVYIYQFTYEGTFNWLKHIKEITAPGASHADELCYQFVCEDYKDLYKNLTPDSKDYKMIKVWSKLYSNFAKTGNPTPQVDDILNISWLPRTRNDRYFLNIDEELKLKKMPENNNIDKWFDIIKNIKEQSVA